MSSKAAKKTAPKFNLYQTVTDRIIASLKAGVIPWEKPWKSPHFTGGPFPRNFRTPLPCAAMLRKQGGFPGIRA